jgi:hypothetical protein
VDIDGDRDDDGDEREQGWRQRWEKDGTMEMGIGMGI